MPVLVHCLVLEFMLTVYKTQESTGTRQGNRKSLFSASWTYVSICTVINLWNSFWIFVRNKVRYHAYSQAIVNVENTNYVQCLKILSFLFRAAIAVSSMLKGVLHLAASLRSCLTSPGSCHTNSNWWKEQVQQDLSRTMTVLSGRP